MMKKLLLTNLIVLFMTGIGLAGELTLLKRTIYVTPQKYLRYWKTPKAAEPVYNTNSWYPHFRFDVLGPIESGSKLYVEIDRAAGTPWMTIKMQTTSLEDDVWETIKPESISSEEEEKQASIETGSFNFRIKLKNPINGTDKVLFTGKFKVNQLTLDQNIPENKGKKEFMVDYDWLLPLAYIWLNPTSDENVPHFSTQVCLKGNIPSGGVEAYLFYNGKQVSKAETIGNPETLTSGADEPHHRYTILQADFPRVRGFNKGSNNNNWSDTFFFDKNPGNYEIKFLRSNQLVRTINFTVGADGKIADNGIAKSVNLGGVRMIFPAKISGTLDGQFNPAAWQTDAIFSNPLQGFSIQ
jgi:hypothetical protein